MRRWWPVLLLALVPACTKYQPVEWSGQGAWYKARQQANLRRTMPDDLETFLASTSRRPIVGQGRHLIVPGETLSGLAERYGVPMARLAQGNGIKPPYHVYAGQVLVLPPDARTSPPESHGGQAVAGRATPPVPEPRRAPRVVVAAVEPAPPPLVVSKPETAPAARPIAVAAPVVAAVASSAPAMTQEEIEATRRAAAAQVPPLSASGFLWPVQGPLADHFGERPNGARNDGINILAPQGTPVLAAESGVVVYAGEDIPSFGKMLLIRHADGFTTTYAHNAALRVAVGDLVERGQEIAAVGATGNVSQPQLHFQLRAGTDPVDPVAYLDRHGTRLASTR